MAERPVPCVPEDLARRLFAPALADMLAERARQVGRFGHDGEADADRPLDYIPRLAEDRLLDALMRLRQPRAGDNLRIARRQLARIGALCLAAMERVDAEIASSAARNGDGGGEEAAREEAGAEA